MKKFVHVYEVVALHVVEVEARVVERHELEAAMISVKEGLTKPVVPDCKFVAIVPGGQETTS
jgi:hypothetical protein